MFCRGLTPPAPLRNKPARRWLRAGNRESGGGRGRFTRRIFWCIIKILPPSPDPLPGGKGEPLGYFMQGATPLASPGRSRGGAGSTGAGGAMRYEPGRRLLRAGNRASGGGLGRFTRRVYFWCIIKILPLSPRPALAERSSPPGKGETLGYFMQGASPLASPGRSRGGTGFFLPCQCFFAPIPPTPFPSGEGGDFRLFYARGFAPCIPGAEPGQRWLDRRRRRPCV